MSAVLRCRANGLQSLPGRRLLQGSTLRSHASIARAALNHSCQGNGVSVEAGSKQCFQQRASIIVTRPQHVSISRAFTTTKRCGIQDQPRVEAEKDTKVIPPPTLAAKSALSARENIYNIPNLLTFSRLVAAPCIGYLIVQNSLPSALALFTYASVTDLLDGWMARRFHLQTVVGSVIDPMADKLLMTVMTVSLAVQGLLPPYLATLILGRDVALATAAIYYRYASLPEPKTMARYWDFSLPSAEVKPTTVSKYNTFLQLLLIGGTLALPVATGMPAVAAHLPSPADVDTALRYFGYLVAGTTAWSGLSYAVLKDAVRIIGTDEVKKAAQGRTGRRIIGVMFGSIVLASGYLAIAE